MTNSDAIALISPAITKTNQPQEWADLGCGSGTFTEALANLLPVGSHILAVDQNPQHIKHSLGNKVYVDFLKADFEQYNLNLSNLDGIMLANSLHYVKDKVKLIHKLESYLSINKTFLIVEYDTTRASQWVPFPIDFVHLKDMFQKLNYNRISKLSEQKSVYGQGNLYCALIN